MDGSEGRPVDGSVGRPEVGRDGRPVDGLGDGAGRVEGRLIEGEGRLMDGERLIDGDREGMERPILAPPRLIPPPPPRPPRPNWAAHRSPQISETNKAPQTVRYRIVPKAFICSRTRVLGESCVGFIF